MQIEQPLDLTKAKPQEKLKYDTATFLKPERLENETYEDYKVRQKVNKLFLKQKKKGRQIWVSTDVHYDKEKDTWHKIGPYTYNKEKFAAAVKAYKEMQEKNKPINPPNPPNPTPNDDSTSLP